MPNHSEKSEQIKIHIQKVEAKDADALGNLTLDDGSGLKFFGNLRQPWIFGQLLQTQSDAFTFPIDRNDLTFDLVALLQHLAGVRNLSRPRHVADVQKSVDTFFQFDKRAIVCQIANRTVDIGSGP